MINKVQKFKISYDKFKTLVFKKSKSIFLKKNELLIYIY